MARKRLTAETLSSVNELAGAREHVRLAESILGPSATDNEILETAQRLSHLRPEQARAINKSRQTILSQNKRIAAAPDGSVDPWDESGPDQPDPTNNQAYTKQIMTSPDHAVLDSLQKKEVHAPTASRAREMSRAARNKYRLARGEEEEEEIHDVEEDVEDDMEEEEEGEFEAEDLLDESEEEVEEAHDVMEDELEDSEFGDEELEDFDGEEEEGIDLDEDRGDLDDMLDMEDEELEGEEDLGEPDIFDDVDVDEVDEGLHHGEELHHDVPASPMSNRKSRPASRQAGRGRRVVPGNRQQGGGKLRTGASGGQGQARISLDEILDVNDEDIERTASTPLEGDDLEALLGSRVDRAGRRVATTKSAERESSAVQQRRAMIENVWDTENEPEILQARGRQPVQRKVSKAQQPQRRQAAKRSRPVKQYAPDRRRTSQRSPDNEFDQVFGVDGMPDVSKFFD